MTERMVLILKKKMEVGERDWFGMEWVVGSSSGKGRLKRLRPVRR
jgi:hypothetical protein